MYQSAESDIVGLSSLLNQDTELLFVGEGANEIIANAFKLPVSDEAYKLAGVVSRKKQIAPTIIKAL